MLSSLSSKETIVGAISGLVVGYIVWLLAVTVGEDITMVGTWSLVLLAASVALGVVAGLWGLWQRRRRQHAWAMFAFALPILPLVLTLAVLADIADVFWF
jgi:heme O synthase-like polyprenyltransferase